MSGDGQREQQWRSSWATTFAIITVLVGYPAFRMAVAYFDVYSAPSGAGGWWALWCVILVGHWCCAAIIFSALRSENASLASIGLNPAIFLRGRWVFLSLLMLFAFGAFFAPGIFYGDLLPDQMRSHPLGPVSSAQRFFWILMAVTAGFVEEIVFRGYALTRLRRFVGLPTAIVISVVSFALMHGPSVFIPQLAVLYLVSGGLFTALFLLMKCRRLELLIITHIALDMILIVAP